MDGARVLTAPNGKEHGSEASSKHEAPSMPSMPLMPMLGQILRISLAAALSTATLPSQVQAARRPTRSSRAEAPSRSEKHHAPTIEASLAPTLSALPESPTTGEPVQLSVLNAPSAATDYRWKLADNAEHPVRFPSAPSVTVQFATAGIHRVTVLITGRQSTQQAALTLRVQPQPPKPGLDANPTHQQPDPPMHSRSGPLKLSALPASPTTGEPVQLSVPNAPSAAADYRWMLAGTAEHPLRLPSAPSVTLQFATAGIHRVTVLITGHRSTQQAALSLRIRSQPGKPARHADPTHQNGDRLPGAAQRAHAASDPVVTISNFQFSPSTITVHVGDTITWTNHGPSAHTATASNGSFDTGLLQKGTSASHTFTQAGTFTYFCRIHPFMHGTVLALPAATTPTASPRPGSGETRPSSASATAPTQTVPSAGSATLPVTGMNVAADAAFGFLLVGLGLTLRRGTAREAGSRLPSQP
jgi:plastocyanin